MLCEEPLTSLCMSTDQSTAALKSTSSTHDVLDSLMVTSKHLITALEKSDWLDRMLIFAALLFFVLVVLFILKQRLIDRSLRIAFFWTRFLPSSSPVKVSKATVSVVKDAVVDAMEKGSASPVMASATMVASSVLSVAPSAAASISTSLSSSSSSILTATPSSVEPITQSPLESLAETLGLDAITDHKSEPERTLDNTETIMPVGTETASHDEL